MALKTEVLVSACLSTEKHDKGGLQVEIDCFIKAKEQGNDGELICSWE